MSRGAPRLDSVDLSLSAAGMHLAELAPLIDGEPLVCGPPQLTATTSGWLIAWPVLSEAGETLILSVAPMAGSEDLRLDLALEGVPSRVSVDSIGLRIGKTSGVLRYLRNGYTSWDGSYFIEPESARGVIDADERAFAGYAMTALVGSEGATAVLGFLRHDRYQSRLRFAFATGPLSIEAETLIDHVAHAGRVTAEPLVLLAGTDVEETLRRWARHVAHSSPLPPRVQSARISGWCSWYSLYNSINEPVLQQHLRAAARFRDRYRVPFEIFQIDDGFTPEMGDWLDVKPQFPRGMAPLLADIRAAGFTPGLWIAPFMIGNRSRLYAEHPDWVVTDRDSGRPLAPMKFYGEFRWHKRSEEYYILDITHPDAEAYIRNVFRVWAREWGCGYFKTDFMYFGSDYGPARARWHGEGLSRMEIWMRMARLIREEIADALWLGCGGPIWAPVGLVDAVRIGRDIGVTWHGHYSAESLLRDQTSRNFANGILWHADPDCILLRDRFHDLTDTEVKSLARFAGLSGGVLMTSDQLDEVPEERRAMFAEFAKDTNTNRCDFPRLGGSPLHHRMSVGHSGQPAVVSEGDPVLIQRVQRPDGAVLINVFNTGDASAERLITWSLASSRNDAVVSPSHEGPAPIRTPEGVKVTVPAHGTCLLVFSGATL
ncbi:MAG: alpha-galactosidase [Gammaproteobacteria bacterium]|nr:alpha-galactosidase [Gammaproteobacteria bacterium]